MTRETAPLIIRTGGGESTVVVASGSLDTAGARVAARWPRSGRAFVVADDAVWALYGPRLLASFAAAGLRVAHRTVPAGEASKSLAQAATLWAWLAGERAERGEPLIALGGGVAGDLAGFVAAGWLRGVPLVAVPTTLLAMVDSSVGGKTGVNLPAGKNLVGAFHHPSLVVADPETLRTLPPREARSGWAEVVKYVLIEGTIVEEVRSTKYGVRDWAGEWEARAGEGASGPPLFDLLRDEGEAVRALREPVASSVIRRCLGLKAATVELDEREGGLRRVLNLGHTIGHAVEAAAGYGRYAHGEAVALGLRGAGRLAVGRGICDISLQLGIDRLLDDFGLPDRIEGCAIDDLLARIGSDKKVRAGRVNWILPTGPGRVVVRDDVPDAEVRAVLAELGAS